MPCFKHIFYEITHLIPTTNQEKYQYLRQGLILQDSPLNKSGTTSLSPKTYVTTYFC